MLKAREFDFDVATLPGELTAALVQSISEGYIDPNLLPVEDEETGEVVEILKGVRESHNVRLDIVSNYRMPLWKQAHEVYLAKDKELEDKRLPNGQRTDADAATMAEARNDVYRYQVRTQITRVVDEHGNETWVDRNGMPFSFVPKRRNAWVRVELGAGPEGGVYVIDMHGVDRKEFGDLNRKFYPELFGPTGNAADSTDKAPVAQEPAESKPATSNVEQD